jgi:hypothetical protein
MKKKDRTKLLKNVCLHCAFFKMHHDKWPDWTPDSGIEGIAAFSDLVRSAVKINAEVFTMLSPQDQMKFMSNVMEQSSAMEGNSGDMLKKVLAAFKDQGPTKH